MHTRGFLCLLYIIAISSSFISASTYLNPVIPNIDTPDPGVFHFGDLFYATTTSQDNASAFPIWASSDLVEWNLTGYVFPEGMWPTWAVSDFWAPEIHQPLPYLFNVYFTARDKTGLLCVGVAVSENGIEGPYKDIGQPLVRTEGMGNIDPTFFIDPNTASRYLYWKADGNAIDQPTPIFVQDLKADGLSFMEGSEPAIMISNTLRWEGAVTEGPWVIFQNGSYYLFYSGNSYANASYAVGVAQAPSATGPFTKFEDPILVTDADNEWIGPGHCSVLSVGNETWMIYHAWPPSMEYRNMMIDQVFWGDNGPYMANSQPSFSPVPYPDISS